MTPHAFLWVKNLKINTMLLMLFSATLALPHSLNFGVFLGLLLVILFQHGRIFFETVPRDHLLLQLLAVYVIAALITAARDLSVSVFFSTLERKIMLLIVPILFAAMAVSQENREKVLKWYVVSVILATAISFVYVSLEIDWLQFDIAKITFYSWRFAENTVIPSNYLALNIGFAMIVIVDRWRANGFFGLSTKIAIIIFLFASLTILGARMSFLATIAVLIFRIFYTAYLTKARVPILPLAAVSLVGILSIAYVPYLRHKFSTGFSTNEPRYFEYRAAVNMFVKKPIWGHGLRGAEEGLVSEYESLGFTEGLVNRYNSHNEILQTAITAGIPGLLILGALYFFCIRHAWRLQEFLPLAFVLFFILASLTEVLLMRIKGIMFFSFFVGLFFFPSAVRK